jgi:hypothetical protein
MYATISVLKRCSVRSSLPPVVCRRASVLFTLFVFVCVQWCPTHIVLCFCLVFHHLVCLILLVSLDCPFLVAPSVFFNDYFQMMRRAKAYVSFLDVIARGLLLMKKSQKTTFPTIMVRLISSPPGRCCSSFQFFVLSYYMSLRFEFRVMMYATISVLKRCSVRSSLPPVVYRGTHDLLTLFLLVFLYVYFWQFYGCNDFDNRYWISVTQMTMAVMT